jgi:hypothetical protein
MDWWTHYYIVLVIALVSILVAMGVAYRDFTRKPKEK